MPTRQRVEGEAQATPSELEEIVNSRIEEIRCTLEQEGFHLFETRYALPQSTSCWDKTKGKWKPYVLATSPLRFIAKYEDINYVFMLNNIAADDIILQVWTLHKSLATDGTLREIRDFGYHLGTYVFSIFPDSHWETQFKCWFEIFHNDIKALPNPREGGRCKCCGKILSSRTKGALSTIHSIVCPDCLDKYECTIR